MEKRKLILNLAISLDGFIAREDGSFDWIVGDGGGDQLTEATFEFNDFLESIDTVVMGKEAYLDSPEEGMKMFQSKKIYVATHQELTSEHENVEFISGDICSQVTEMLTEKGKDIWLYGGAGVADQFIKADMIDDYIIGIIPVILGSGRPLFLKDNPTLELQLEECTAADGIVIMRYSKREA